MLDQNKRLTRAIITVTSLALSASEFKETHAHHIRQIAKVLKTGEALIQLPIHPCHHELRRSHEDDWSGMYY